MKKLIGLLLVLVLISSCAMAEMMMVHITATCYDTNGVGQYWKGNYAISGYQTFDGDVLDLNMGRYDFYTEIIDYDNSPDIGAITNSVNITANRLTKGFTVDQYLTVEENRGVHKGNWCEWYITWEFTPCIVGTPFTIH